MTKRFKEFDKDEWEDAKEDILREKEKEKHKKNKRRQKTPKREEY